MTAFICTSTALGVSACKRETRMFQVPPTAARATATPANTPVRAGGAPEPAAALTPTTTMPTTTMPSYLPLSPPADFDSNAEALSRGRVLFNAMNCAGCHAAGGGGGIGPALIDDVWIYGPEPGVIFDTISNGRANGMPAFGGRIADYQIWQLVAYVRSLSGLASPQAAPGRGDDMATAPPPNSIRRANPRSATVQLDQLQQHDRAAMERLGWIDRTSGQPRLPDRIANRVSQKGEGATIRAATTRPNIQ